MYLTQNSTVSVNQNTGDTNPQQVQNYISWLNSHLRKRPGVKLVDNLQKDMCDGVLFIHLIEVISGDVFPDANLNPKTSEESRENIEKVLKFMQKKTIKMHQTSTKEIIEGNLKSIMRLILALAAHFKPANIQYHNNQQNRSPNSTSKQNPVHNIKNESMAHLVQAACVSLSDSRRFQARNEGLNVTYIKKEHVVPSDAPFDQHDTKHDDLKRDETYNVDTLDDIEDYLTYHNEISKDVEDAKRLLLNLQNLLINGAGIKSEDETLHEIECLFQEGSTTQDEQIAILRSKNQQLEILCNDLRQELSAIKNESMQINGVQCGLQIRLSEQDSTVLQMKSEILQLNITNEQITKEKSDLLLKLEEKIRLINELKYELNNKTQLIEKMKSEVTSLSKEKENTKYLKQQVKTFTDTLQKVKEKENTLANLIASTDRKLGVIDSKMANRTSKKLVTHDEISSLKDSIIKLRNTFKPNHPLQYVVNTIEQGFYTIIERVNTNSSGVQVSSPPGAAQSANIMQPNGVAKTNPSYSNGGLSSQSVTPLTSSSSSSTTSNSKADFNGQSQHYASTLSLQHQNINHTQVRTQTSQPLLNYNPDNKRVPMNFNNQHNEMGQLSSTKAIYYMDKSVTPYMTTIYKNIGKITLYDFKEALKLKPNNYRFHFKTQDPEFGIVKEEIANDGTLLPSYEGKIISWIQENE